VNDRLDVALAAGAAGVHLRGDSVAPSRVRKIVPAGFIVGRSVHSVAEAMAAAPDVDYLIAGTIWPSPSKPPDRAAAGPGLLRRIARSAGVPVLAIGGVTLERMPEIASAGAAGAAAIGLFMDRGGPMAPDPECRAVALLETARSARALFAAAGSADRLDQPGRLT
jgi:thiamine-phosphate pyrophosphorylase